MMKSNENQTDSNRNVGLDSQNEKTASLAKADKFFVNQDYAGAWQELNRIVQNFGGSFEIFAAMALCSMSLNDLERARLEYLTSVRYNPENPEVRLNLAVVEKSLGMFNDAFHQVQIVLGMNQDDLLARRLAADINVQRGKFDLAVTDYQRVIRHDPKDIQVLLGYGRALFSLERYEEAIKVYESILALDPSHEIAADNILVSRKKLGQNLAAPFEGDRKTLLEKAQNEMNNGNHALAKKLLKPLVFSTDATADICFVYGNLCLLEGNSEEALVNFTKMVDLDPQDIRGHLKLSAIACSVGLKELARQHLSVAQSIDPNHQDLQEVEIEVLMTERNYLPAAQMIYQIISQDMTQSDMVAKLGLCFENLGDFELAAETYKKALEYEPGHLFANESMKRIEHLTDKSQSNSKSKSDAMNSQSFKVA